MADHEIEWYYPEFGQIPDGSINDIVSHIPGVKTAVHLKANSLASEAWMSLMWHHKTGAAHIEVGRHPKAGARSPDWYVYMRDRDPGGEGIGNAKGNRRDRSAMSIEFGWDQTHVFGRKLKKPIHHDGLNILGGVIARAAARHRG
jgi:hypothetical protein